jgi:hypothetical protein
MVMKNTINAYVAFAFLAAYSLGVGLVLWHAVLGNNPIADMLQHEMTANVVQQ